MVDTMNDQTDANSSSDPYALLGEFGSVPPPGTLQAFQQANLNAGNQQQQNNNNNNGSNIPQPGMFSADTPEVWFAIAEADFTANRITSDNQKYSQTLKALPISISKQLWDIISNPPPQDKYPSLKNAILSRFSDSRQTQLHKLLRDMTLGDRRPSQLLREMRELARGSIDDEAMRQLWKERLPATVRPYLLVSPNLNDLKSLAEMADRLVLNMGNSSVYAVHNKDHSPSTGQTHLEQQLLDLRLTTKNCQQDISNLQQQLQQQLLLINNLTQQTSRVNQNNRGHHSRARSITPNRNGYCYYHSRWGIDACKCIQPCKFNPIVPNNQGN
ncbi:uncharacterized protein LOC103579908 [Microplitis demolitor]|uniref:uncharacterized protein LOC103579908 n=1 Tax=Microplitis demolitor TaxID=69319 RepID=UPI00235B6FAD|nr:uncharacterized protein LOC103579908 [Microplitis demolitor]